VSYPLAIAQTGLLPARHRSRSGEAGGLSDTLHRVSFHLKPYEAYPNDHNYTPACHRLSFHVLYGSSLLAMAGRYFGANYRACILASSGFRLLLQGLPSGSATDPARLTSESVAGRLLASGS